MSGPTDITEVIDVPAGGGPRHAREGDVIRARLSALDPERERRFRINAGVGFTGSKMRRVGSAMIIVDPRPLRAAPEGWPDLCGWDSIEVTPDMVGSRIAVFVAEEVKCSGGLRPEQRAFKNCLEKMGGIYRIIRP